MDKKKIVIVILFLAAMVAAGIGLKIYQSESQPVYQQMANLKVLLAG